MSTRNPDGPVPEEESPAVLTGEEVTLAEPAIEDTTASPRDWFLPLAEESNVATTATRTVSDDLTETTHVIDQTFTAPAVAGADQEAAATHEPVAISAATARIMAELDADLADLVVDTPFAGVEIATESEDRTPAEEYAAFSPRAANDSGQFPTDDDAAHSETAPEGNVDGISAAETEATAATDSLEDTSVLRRSLLATPETSAGTPLETTEETSFRADSAGTAPGEPGFPGPFPTRATAVEYDESTLDGATVQPELRSRAGARFLSFFAFLLLTPVTWFLLSDSTVRLLLATDNPRETGIVNLATLGEVAGGIAVMVVLLVVALQSSLGLYLGGALLTLVGGAFLVAPGWCAELLAGPIADYADRFGVIGQNFRSSLELSGFSGTAFLAGVAMILAGWGMTRARRKGRAEESLRAEIAANYPQGIKARWARKASTQAEIALAESERAKSSRAKNSQSDEPHPTRSTDRHPDSSDQAADEELPKAKKWRRRKKDAAATQD